VARVVVNGTELGQHTVHRTDAACLTVDKYPSCCLVHSPSSSPSADGQSHLWSRTAIQASSFRYNAYAVALADLVALLVVRCVVDLAEIVFDAAGDGDQEQPGGLVFGPEP